jgi:hypothetical protein
VLFRGNTLTTKAIDYYMKLVGKDYLSSTLGPLINVIYEEKKNCDVPLPAALRTPRQLLQQLQKQQQQQ